jgi:DNA polymerase sigma
MSAVKDILEKANLMIDELIIAEDERLTDLENEYMSFLNGKESNGLEVRNFLISKINTTWNTNFKDSMEIRRHKSYSRDYDKIQNDLLIAKTPRSKKSYLDLVRQTNLQKLEGAIEKHGITDDMKADNVKLTSGKKGLEIHADINGKKFITFAVLAGGYIQRYHYRYRSSFK